MASKADIKKFNKALVALITDLGGKKIESDVPTIRDYSLKLETVGGTLILHPQQEERSHCFVLHTRFLEPAKAIPFVAGLELNGKWNHYQDDYESILQYVETVLRRMKPKPSLPVTVEGLDVTSLANELYNKWSTLDDNNHRIMSRDLFMLAIQDVVVGKTI